MLRIKRDLEDQAWERNSTGHCWLGVLRGLESTGPPPPYKAAYRPRVGTLLGSHYRRVSVP